MKEELRYNEIKGSLIRILHDEHDFEILLNNVCVATTGDENEAYIIAESLDVALSVLNSQSLLLEKM
jgi:hypothetical protein